MRLIYGLSLVILSSACTFQLSNKEQNTPTETHLDLKVDSTQLILKDRILVPEGFKRVDLDSSSFGSYLRNIPLKPHGTLVKYYDGKVKENSNIYCAVIDQDIDPLNLQQCADAVMRLRGEYLYAQKKFADIHFNYVSDQKPHYFSSFANGNYSYQNFRKYMKQVFNFANTSSLKNELKKVDKFEDIQAGDVLIQSGNPYGHAVIVMDVATNETTGEKAFLLAQSYMPAQETQILINPRNTTLSPWYSPDGEEIITPQWKFVKGDLRRFE